MAEDLTLTADAVLRNPFPAYKWLRDEAPVYKDPVSGVYVITRYDDIEAIAGDPETFSSSAQMQVDGAFLADDEAGRILREHAAPHVDTLQSADPPAHTKYRSIVQGAFHPRRINKMSEYMNAICAELIEKFENNGKCEILADLAIPLPMYIISDQLGVPRQDYKMFKRWSDSRVLLSDLRLPIDVRVDCAKATLEMQAYLKNVAAQYRQNPGDNILTDIVNSEIDGRLLNDEEMLGIATQLIVAGNETTTNTIALGLRLMCDQGLEQELREDFSKIPVFVEEVLRLTSVLQGLYRKATREVAIRGVTIPEGATVMLRWAAANRDERKFADPDVLRLDRKNANQHLTFGSGIHYCLGNALARSELKIVFTNLLSRLKNFRVAAEPDSERWIVHAFASGMSRLVMEFDHV
ncbi:cytochrome P450 [Sphingobium sp. V4]|uniref:cytochrome P450 n=1 Tax=Sphingobium sp. V4 TaxID=3038927 RepID=UPI0025583A85|nr:cytochrome P450 [Sphingobium sp. V4]WIW89529.1 cytochrome P450 [Sphingobium sp. V4]